MTKHAPAPMYYERLPEKEIERIWNDTEELIRWTIAQLVGEPDPEPHSPYRVFRTLVQKDDLEGFKRMLAKHPEDAAEAMLMYAELTFPKRDRGRPKRGSTAKDYVHQTNMALAVTDMHWIGVIWRQQLGKRRWKPFPKPIDIAAQLRGVTTKQ